MSTLKNSRLNFSIIPKRIDSGALAIERHTALLCACDLLQLVRIAEVDQPLKMREINCRERDSWIAG